MSPCIYTDKAVFTFTVPFNYQGNALTKNTVK